MTTPRLPKAPTELVTPLFGAIIVFVGTGVSILLNWVFDDVVAAQIVGTYTAICGAWILVGLMFLLGSTFNIWRKRMAAWEQQHAEWEQTQRNAADLNRRLHANISQMEIISDRLDRQFP